MKPKRLPEFSENDITRFYHKIDVKPPDECWKWMAAHSSDGRGKFTMKRSGKNRCLNAPRVAYFIHSGHDPFPYHVLHKCNNAWCCNPFHLYLGNDADNRSDSAEAKTHYHGTRHHRAKLTEVDVASIKTELMAGERGYALADRFGVCERTISGIRRGQTWKQVDVPGFAPFTTHGNKGRRKGA